jgi:hypothetical protein
MTLLVAVRYCCRFGDALYSKQPLGALALAKGFHCSLVYKRASHPKLDTRVAFWQAHDAIIPCERRHWNCHFTAVAMYRLLHDVLFRDRKGPSTAKWFELTVVNATMGAQLYPNSFITNPQDTADNSAELAQAGRGRWKIANANNNVLKTKRYHI